MENKNKLIAAFLALALAVGGLLTGFNFKDEVCGVCPAPVTAASPQGAVR